MQRNVTQRFAASTTARRLAMMLAAASLIWAAPALAQDKKDAKPSEVKKRVLDPSNDLDAAELRGVEAVAPRAVLKEGRLGISAYAGVVPNNIFEQYFPVGLRLNYFILENIGIELAGAYTIGSDTGLIDTLKDGAGIGANGVLLGDKQVAHMNFGVTWSPIFGKTTFQNRGLNYFDFFVFGGFGVVVKQTQTNFGTDPSTGVEPEGALGLGMLFYLNQDMALRADYRQFIHQKITGGVANPSEASFGFTYFAW